jgi:surface antigen
MPLFDPSLRRRVSSLIVGLFVLSTPGLAVAQTLINSDVAWPGLSHDDIDRMHAAASRLYEGRSIGTIERWRSPDSKNAGEVKLVRSFDAYQMPCRRLDYTIRFDSVRDRPSHYVVNWCKIPEGDWKIVELVAPR